MTLVVKAERRSVRRRRQTPPPSAAGASPQARRQAATILEVLAGVRRPSEAAQVLEISLPRYYQLEQRALAGLVSACSCHTVTHAIVATNSLRKIAAPVSCSQLSSCWPCDLRSLK